MRSAVVALALVSTAHALSVNIHLPFVAGQRADTVRDERGSPYALYEHEALSPEKQREASRAFLALAQTRRTLRIFDRERAPSLDVVTDCIHAAGTAPSGAHKQPWSYVCVRDADVKRQIREIVEREERRNYNEKMSESWKDDLASMMSNLHDNADINKPYLTEAPFLILLFAQPFAVDADGRRAGDHYYVSESVGISLGVLISALHSASVCSLVSTPMGTSKELKALLGRPDHERLVALLPVGFPAADATVPFRPEQRKPLDEILTVV